MVITRQAHMLLAYAIHHLKVLIEEIVVSKYPQCLFYKLFPKDSWDFHNFLAFLAITLEPEMVESQSTRLKLRTTTWFPIKLQAKKLAVGVGAQCLIILSKYA